MTNNHEDLIRALKTEADLAEALLGVVRDKQKAILSMQGETIIVLSRREEEFVNLLRTLEAERLKIIGEAEPAAATRRELSRLKTAAEKIVALNANNRMLLQHSLRFVQETLKAVTDDHRRKIVDARI